MKRITIIESRNGYLVIDGTANSYEYPVDLAARTWSFNSLDRAIAHIRTVLKAWRQEAAEPKGGKPDET